MRNRESGMTIVEVLVSLGVMSFIALSLMSMLSISLHLNKLAQERSIATALASERIHQITAMPFEQAPDYKAYALPEETTDDGPPQTLTSDYGEIPEFPRYRRVVELTYNTPVNGMLAVETTVTWEHIGQGERSHVMISYLHPGLE